MQVWWPLQLHAYQAAFPGRLQEAWDPYDLRSCSWRRRRRRRRRRRCVSFFVTLFSCHLAKMVLEGVDRFRRR